MNEEMWEQQNVLLVVLYSFYMKGEKEVSLSGFLDCVKRIQKQVPLNYEFSRRFLYSLELLEDLRDLEYQGFVHRLAYRHDAFLPKRFIKLTESGKAHSHRLPQELPSELIPIIESSVDDTIQSSREKWRLFERPMTFT